MVNFKINSDFSHLENFLLDIKLNFQKNQDFIHKARNEIKNLKHDDLNITAKSFKIPNFFNRLIYSFFRKSKAKKSYLHAAKVGDFTPKPIGYIEFYENFLLNESYFLSEYFKYDFTIREPLLDKNFKNKDEIFRAFARFTFALHEKNIFHKDFSPGNILVKQKDEEYIFKIVDINRMKFQALSFNLRAKSFSKLWANDEDLKTVSNEYAKIYGVDKELFTKKTLHYSRQLKRNMNFKKRLKGERVVD